MEREYRLSAGMAAEKVTKVCEALKAAFEKRRKKLSESEAKMLSVIPSGEKR